MIPFRRGRGLSLPQRLVPAPEACPCPRGLGVRTSHYPYQCPSEISPDPRPPFPVVWGKDISSPLGKPLPLPLSIGNLTGSPSSIPRGLGVRTSHYPYQCPSEIPPSPVVWGKDISSPLGKPLPLPLSIGNLTGSPSSIPRGLGVRTSHYPYQCPSEIPPSPVVWGKDISSPLGKPLPLPLSIGNLTGSPSSIPRGLGVRTYHALWVSHYPYHCPSEIAPRSSVSCLLSFHP